MSYVEVPGAKVPIRMWADPATVEEGALQQLRNVSTLPWIKGLAVMPDVHYGKGATVGSVIAMQGAVCPAAVGVDIGCGMSAVKTSSRPTICPVTSPGCARRSSRPSRWAGACTTTRSTRPASTVSPRRAGTTSGPVSTGSRRPSTRQERATKQMGTLGSGNHFVEVCVDSQDAVWLMLHSGSRNIGKELAEHHMGVAQSLPHNQGLVDRDLAVFVADTPQMAAYRNDLFWAQEYAKYNRALMMSLLKDVVRREFKKAKVTFQPEISCHHNYVSEERYDGMDLLVTRKGAIRAGSGDLGIIPGSMGTGSYIVRGLGNEESFNSACTAPDGG